MKRLSSILAALATLFALSFPAVAQNVGIFQNGVPTGPSVIGSDTNAGVYFGTGRIGAAGHLEAGAAAFKVPTASLCGAAIDAGSTDTAGSITNVGTTTCTITFGTAFTAIPSCTVTNGTSVRAGQVNTVSNTALTISAITAGDKLSWICIAKSGG